MGNNPLNSRREPISPSINKRRRARLGSRQRSTRYTGHPPLPGWLVTTRVSREKEPHPARSLAQSSLRPLGKQTPQQQVRKGRAFPHARLNERGGARGVAGVGVGLKRRGRAEPQAPPLRDAPGIGAAEAAGPPRRAPRPPPTAPPQAGREPHCPPGQSPSAAAPRGPARVAVGQGRRRRSPARAAARPGCLLSR